jgi:lysosomal acid lipase/cholesteryl ester hydrolase
MILNNTFRSFDYGEQGNQQHYGTTTPPAYPLEKVRLPVHLFVGLLDKLADVQDSEQLFSELTGAQNKSIKLLRMGHAGFIWN